VEDGGGGSAPAPTGNIPHQLDNLERLGKIVNAVGVPLLMVFFLALSIGWIDSPLARSIRENNAMNDKIYEQQAIHHRKMLEMEEHRIRSFNEALDAMKRLTEVLKMVDCSAIVDKQLRDRCLSR
jgi:hypothetical protein